MKKRALIRHLSQHNCSLLRQGAKHEWWENHASTKRSAIPRHTEISNQLARKICNDLGVPLP
ncbi:MAG: type II toxin-antitoxin system HicA family toxin [Gammaproteobacteria bacterium]|nr:type II toxin-antitoxin system HicA family toxin [Gammaproteobacteria bacterium]MDE0366035.1 type II toxin-antitoxin system HicA family toxin [Gammaproteobacteria bacterium]